LESNDEARTGFWGQIATCDGEGARGAGLEVAASPDGAARTRHRRPEAARPQQLSQILVIDVTVHVRPHVREPVSANQRPRLVAGGSGKLQERDSRIKLSRETAR